MLARGITLCLFLTVIPLSLFASDILELHNKRYWHTLLHFKNGMSEIDDIKFFLSSDGKYNPKKELEATIDALRKNKEQIFCKFPARSQWILEHDSILKEEIGDYSCSDIDTLIQEYDPKSVSLIFPTAHINAPSSMYGHSFLRIDHNKKTPLISQAINYAAQTRESNGVLFAYHGLTGGYKGRYSITPYYEKIKEYNDMERRDIWEYELNLSIEEIRRLLYHQFELKAHYADYFFFTENCSYNLLWLLEAARVGVKITDKFHLKAIPIDTIRAVKDEGFVSEVVYRASKSKKIKEIVKNIDDIVTAKSFINQNYDGALIKEKSPKQKAYILDLSSELLRYKRAKNKIEKKVYIKDLMRILGQRSQIGVTSDYTIAKPSDPLEGHKTNRLRLSIKEDAYLLSFKPSFHDIYDLEKGFIEGAYINFFDLALQKNHDESIKLEKFDIVNIASYAPRDQIFKPLSWEIAFGWIRNYKDVLEFTLRGGVGHSYESMGFLYYLFLSPSLYMSNELSASLSPKIGIIKNFSSFKMGAVAQREFFSYGEEITRAEVFSTYNIYKDISLNLKYDITDSKKRGTVSLFYYF